MISLALWQVSSEVVVPSGSCSDCFFLCMTHRFSDMFPLFLCLSAVPLFGIYGTEWTFCSLSSKTYDFSLIINKDDLLFWARAILWLSHPLRVRAAIPTSHAGSGTLGPSANPPASRLLLYPRAMPSNHPWPPHLLLLLKSCLPCSPHH